MGKRINGLLPILGVLVMKPLKIGLTGGIGSGKSTVAAYFTALGIPIIDADAVARTVVAPNQPALAAISAAFGADLIDEQGVLQRNRLREIVFENPLARKQLEAILHPLIRAEMVHQVTIATTPYVILMVPLLLESGFIDLVDRVLVVDVAEQTQLERTQRRDGLSPLQVTAVLAAQANRCQRLAAAHDVISNEGEVADLDYQVALLHQRYLELANS